MTDTKSDLRQQRAAAKSFAEANAVALAREILEWQKTAILRDGLLRELARICTFADHDALKVAEHIATAAILEALAADAEGDAVPRTWKVGNEFSPFHPQASHVSPDYRDGWNDCYAAAVRNRIPMYWCAACHAVRPSLPKPAEGCCVECSNHLINVRQT